MVSAEPKENIKELEADVKGFIGPANKEERQAYRLEILKKVLLIVGFGFVVSITITCFFAHNGMETPSELIVLNTILGSTLTTIVGVIAGTSID